MSRPDLAATVEALHAEVADLRRQLAEARDAERGAVVAWLRRYVAADLNSTVAMSVVSWERAITVSDCADYIADNAHRVTP